MTAIQTGIYLRIRGEIKPKGRMGEDIFFPFYYFLASIFIPQNTKTPSPPKKNTQKTHLD